MKIDRRGFLAGSPLMTGSALTGEVSLFPVRQLSQFMFRRTIR
jgi:hypothetical protein